MQQLLISALILINLIYGAATLHAQSAPPYTLIPDADAPEWVFMMQAEQPDITAIQAAYDSWRIDHRGVKNRYTQYYKHWMKWASIHQQPDGNLRRRTAAESAQLQQHLQNLRGGDVQERNADNWSFIGPKTTYDTDGVTEVTWQTNIYCVEIAPSNPNILYAGGETGGIWKTTDKGLNWTLITANLRHESITALAIHPTNPDTVYAATEGRIIKSTNGGTDWIELFALSGLDVNEFAINPANPTKIYAATQIGLYYSTDRGLTWNQVFNQKCWTIKYKVNDPAEAFAIVDDGSNGFIFYHDKNPVLDVFEATSTGWWTPVAGQEVTGARLAICPSNPAKIYAYLIGEGGNLLGYVGVFVSEDGGLSWANANPNNYISNVPFIYQIPDHVNLATNNGRQTGFDQGFYNMAILVNPNNEDELIAGGTSWWKSTDGGKNWNPLGGYVGPLQWSHPDLQWLAASGNDLWIASDGGLNYSTNFAGSITARMNGISGSDMWGFDAGWNEDVLVGGRYHNGNTAYHQSFPAGKFYRMGGAEAPTGYVNPGDNRKTYFSDIGGYRLNGSFTGGVTEFGTSIFPNEDYASYANSEMVFDPRDYSTVFLGYENKLWRSRDGGTSFEVLYTFPGSETRKVYEIEISRSNPNVMYCSQFNGTDDVVWRSTNAGVSWTIKTPLPPFNNNDRIKMALSAEDENLLWVSVTYGNNGSKVFKSIDGGTNWENITTPILDGIRVSNIMAQYGTDGGVYLGCDGAVFYRNNSHSDWQPYSTGLPISAETNRLKPFYRDGKIRNGCWGFGIWEADLFEPSSIIAQPIASSLDVKCTRDTVYLDDYSIVNHAGATWNWTFSSSPTYVSATNVRNPKVVFGTPGTYTATMTLSKGGTDYSQSLTIQVTNGCDYDTIPGRAMRLGGNNNQGFGVVPPVNLNSNSLTISAWVLADGIQPNWSSIFMTQTGEAAGFNVREGNNTLGYHWPGGNYNWDSNLTIPDSVWTHVAMVVEPSGITLYVNGVGVKHNFTAAPVDFSVVSSRLGTYRGWDDRNMKGAIDEVCIFNTPLSQAAIRELMHLTKYVPQQPNLIAYYQFNELNGNALDRVSNRHVSLAGSAVRIESSCPVGGGRSKRLNVNAGGTFDFEGTGVTMEFPASGTYPNGELCVTRINLDPHRLPVNNENSAAYWVVNNYGSNTSFSTLSAIRFDEYGAIAASTTAADYKLYKRSSFAEGAASWGPFIDEAENVTPGANGSVLFSSGNNISSFSQFLIANATVALPVEWLIFTAKTVPNQRSVQLQWTVNQTADNDRFEVERSTDGLRFTPLSTVTAQLGQGRFDYELFDQQPANGINYYRIRQIDLDGKISLSPIRQVKIGDGGSTWSVVPNPLTAGQPIKIVTDAELPYRFTLVDMNGRIVLDRKLTGTTSMTDWELPVGLYTYLIQSDLQRMTGKLVIANHE
jgi:photosystem II stability/assembly factor-like uncharacterized protein